MRTRSEIKITGKIIEEASDGMAVRLIFLSNLELLCVIASWGGGWDHVSVHVAMPKGKTRCPTWDEMCYVKSVFWNENEYAIQYHPAKKDYKNFHKHCLHLWKPQNQEVPKPPLIMV